MLQYFRPLFLKFGTVSIDNVVCDYNLHPRQRESFLRVLEKLSLEYCCEVTHWDNLKMGSYKLQFSVALPDGNSFWVGVGLNTTKTHYSRIRLEFNPNKVAGYDCFRKLLGCLNSSSSPLYTYVVRYDLAVDFPVLRENACLVKDNRVYTEISHSLSDKTQYLGTGSKPGRVKLYNKGLESKLGYPLTRLELTLDPETPYDDVNWPKVYFVRDLQLAFDELKLNDTDRFILGALLQGYGSLSQLGRKTREKLSKVMENYVDFFRLPWDAYEKIRAQLRDFIRYPEISLKGWPAKEAIEPYLLPAVSDADWAEIFESTPFDEEAGGG